MNWYQRLILSSSATYLESTEFLKRLSAIGWEIDQRNATHVVAIAPNKKDRITMSIGPGNWKKSWIVNRRRTLQISEDLLFVWQNPFIIPDGYNPQTLQIEETQSKIQKVYLESISPSELKNYSINIQGQWEKIIDIDPDYINNKVTVMTETGNIQDYPVRQPAEVRIAA